MLCLESSGFLHAVHAIVIQCSLMALISRQNALQFSGKTNNGIFFSKFGRSSCVTFSSLVSINNLSSVLRNLLCSSHDTHKLVLSR